MTSTITISSHPTPPAEFVRVVIIGHGCREEYFLKSGMQQTFNIYDERRLYAEEVGSETSHRLVE